MVGRGSRTRVDLPHIGGGQDRYRILIIEGRYYDDICDALLEGAVAEIEAAGAAYDCITVPGALEIPQVLGQAINAGLFSAADQGARYSGAVALGCVIRGETSHYDIVAGECARGIQDVQLTTGVPIAFGVLTTEDEQQALARSEGPGGHNVGEEAALVAVEMARIAQRFT